MVEELTREHYEVAVKNGIPRRTVYYRYNYQFWSIERSITEPVHTKAETRKMAHEKNKKDKYRLRDLAKENGIGWNTFYDRIRKGWNEHLAATTPPGTFIGRYNKRVKINKGEE